MSLIVFISGREGGERNAFFPMTMHVGECAFYHSAFKRTDFESITFNVISSIFISMENIFQTLF